MLLDATKMTSSQMKSEMNSLRKKYDIVHLETRGKRKIIVFKEPKKRR